MSTTAKRKAQELVRKGKIQEAIQTLKDGISDGETDPYDHVYLGDLHMRVEEKDECLFCYQTAITSYREVGLVRNAIAIGKKMLRIDSKRPEVHRTLAELYDDDGLHGEAIPHYLTYLDSFAGESVPPTEFLDTLDKAASITGSRVEVALRLADHFIRVNSGEKAAQLLEEVADNAGEGGDDMASELRRRAADLRGGPPPMPDMAEELPMEMELDAPPELPPPPPPLEDAPPIAIDTSAMERALESSADADDSQDSGAFVVEHFPASESPKEDAQEPPALPASDLDFGDVDLGAPAATGDEEELPFGELTLDAEDTEEDVPLAEGPGEDGVFEIDVEDESFDFGAVGEDSDEPAASSRTMAMEIPPELASAFAADTSSDSPSDRESDDDVVATTDGFGEVDLDTTQGGNDKDEAFDFGVLTDATGTDATDIDATDSDAADETRNEADASFAWDDSSDDALAPETDGLSPQPETVDAHAGHTESENVAAADSAPEEVLDQANDAFLDGQWSKARNLYDAVLELDAGNRRVLAKLVETVRYLEDEHAEVHYLSLLGDAWIEEEQLEEALECFLKVVRLDPENATAKRRLSRFREMGVRGAEVIEESDSNSVAGVLETGRSEIEVRSDNSSEFRSEDWVELEGLLEEFKDGLKKQMDDSDYQGHYDLALSHHGMGLYEEALEAVEFVLGSSGIPAEVARQARELKGSCLVGLERHREAVHEYREAAELSGGDPTSRRTALYNLGRSLEALEEWQEAAETYVRLRLEAPGFLDVEDRIRACEGRRDSPTEAA